MKKVLSTILALVCFVAMMLASGEKQDGSPAIWWSLGCIAVACLCGWLLTKVNPNFWKDGIFHDTRKSL